MQERAQANMASAMIGEQEDVPRLMRNGVFPRLCQFLLALLLLLLDSPSAHAGPINLDARDNALGSANSFGYARIVRQLGDMPLGGMSYPVNLVFNTNPMDEPGAFGPYWRIPLFTSTVVQYNQYKLYWDGPDERRQFFVLDQSDEGSRGEKVFVERGKDWKATVGRGGEVLIEALDGSNWMFRYDGGRLQEFKLGDSADLCRITYSGRDLPLYITSQATNRRIFEIEYRGATKPESITIGDKRTVVEMGDGDATAPDGETDYRNYRVSFLKSLAFSETDIERFTYTKAEHVERKVPLPGKGIKRKFKTIDLAVNRMEASSGQNADVGNSWVEWKAKSGFVTADSGSTYAVKNEAWNWDLKEGTPSVTPITVDITRLPDDGEEQEWSYGWKSGVSVFTDRATGEIIRKTIIMSEGPANGRLRKKEVLKDKEWTIVEKNSYGPKGRMLRSVKGGDVRIWKWEDSQDGSTVTEYFNQTTLGTIKYSPSGNVKVREMLSSTGIVHRYVHEGDGVTGYISHYTDGALISKTRIKDGLKLFERIGAVVRTIEPTNDPYQYRLTEFYKDIKVINSIIKL